jgi:hypothetical protein
MIGTLGPCVVLKPQAHDLINVRYSRRRSIKLQRPGNHFCVIVKFI